MRHEPITGTTDGTESSEIIKDQSKNKKSNEIFAILAAFSSNFVDFWPMFGRFFLEFRRFLSILAKIRGKSGQIDKNLV